MTRLPATVYWKQVSTPRKWEKQVPAGRILFMFLSPCGNASRCCETHLVLVARIETERRAVLLRRSAEDISMLSLVFNIKKHGDQKRHCQVVIVVVSFLHPVMGRLAAVCVDTVTVSSCLLYPALLYSYLSLFFYFSLFFSVSCDYTLNHIYS